MATGLISSEQFSKMAAAILGQTGGIDINNHAQLKAFTDALVAADSSSEEEDSPHRPAVKAAADSSSGSDHESWSSTDEANAMQQMLKEAETMTVAAVGAKR